MINGHLLRWIFLVVLTSVYFQGFTQRIDNIYPEIEGDKINIYYDLLGIDADQSVDVKVFMSADGGKTYGQSLQSVAGDVGVVQGPGKEKCIIWDVFRDVDELVSVNVKFKIEADLLRYEQTHQSMKRQFKLNLNSNLGSKGNLESKSFGFNLKGVIYFDQLGLGLRGDYYKTFREKINYSDPADTENRIYPDTGYYWGYGGGAIIEYDFFRSRKYSLYPYLYIGQTKILYKYNPDYKEDEYFKYSIFGTIGLGFDINLYKFLYLGTEIEYYLSPWLDIVPSAANQPDESIDGLSIGITLKFVINPD